jgi:hypothetical protein
MRPSLFTTNFGKTQHLYMFMAQEPLVSHSFFIIEASQSHSDTPYSVQLLRTSDHNTQHSQATDIHVPGEIRTHNPSKRAAEDPRLRPRDHWDRHNIFICPYLIKVSVRPYYHQATVTRFYVPHCFVT